MASIEQIIKFENEQRGGVNPPGEPRGGVRRPAEPQTVIFGGSPGTARPTCACVPEEHQFRNNESFK